LPRPLFRRINMNTKPDCLPALLYRLPEVARLLSLSPRKVRLLITSGILPSFKIDHCRVVRHSDLILYVNQLGA
jgi:hypothetical protein